MDSQTVVDGIRTAASVLSVEKKEGGGYGTIRIVAANSAYRSTFRALLAGMKLPPKVFEPNSDYTEYMPRDLNFEDACYRAAVCRQYQHSYVHPAKFNMWLNTTLVPLEQAENSLCCCLYIVEFSSKQDAKIMSAISADIATSVLETCIKLRSPDDFQTTMNEVCRDIRDLCDSEHCCVLLMDTAKRKCSILCEAFSKDTKLLPMAKYVDDAFYDIADSWKDLIAGSTCLIVKNEHDWELVKKRNPVWHNSITSAGGKTIVLFPLEFKGELLGYIWAINFSDDAADTIRETLELTTFILASELYSYRMLDRLHVLSSRDMLTGVMNRNEMNNTVDDLTAGKCSQSVGVVFADLNGLKTINDTGGHAAGDALLKTAAGVLRQVFNRNEIFRAGGDEFVVILTGVTEEELHQRADAIRKAAECCDGLYFAIGTAYEQNAADVHAALHSADVRMYEDKKRFYELYPERKLTPVQAEEI